MPQSCKPNAYRKNQWYNDNINDDLAGHGETDAPAFTAIMPKGTDLDYSSNSIGMGKY